MMETVWIIGAGRFGLLALERLSKRRRPARFLMVDPRASLPDHLIDLPQDKQVRLRREEGTTFLATHLESADPPPDWIVPAAPVHVAAEWCLHRLAAGGVRRQSIPREIVDRLPNPVAGQGGDLYVSHATFLCPDDCAEPAGYCTVTGRARPREMFDLLAEAGMPGWPSWVVRSRQMAPGVGGYRPKALLELMGHLARQPRNCLVSTACRCHGVMTGLHMVPPGPVQTTG